MSEFETWLAKNRTHLRGYTPEEISKVALACGFWTSEISAGLSHGFMNVQTRTTLKQREDRFVGQELKQAEAHGGSPDLEEQWHCLANKECWDMDFAEAA